ncbi:unnamed protein product, partial [Sphacelaria rigidula]
EDLLRIEATWFSRHMASFSPNQGLMVDSEAVASHHGEAAPVGTATTSSKYSSSGGTKEEEDAAVTAIANCPPSSAEGRTCEMLSPPPRGGRRQAIADSSAASKTRGAITAVASSSTSLPTVTTEMEDGHEQAARETSKAPEVMVPGNGDGSGGSSDVREGAEEHRERRSRPGSPSSTDKATHETEKGLKQECDTPDCEGGEQQVSEESLRRSGEEACASSGSRGRIYGWNELLTVDLVLWYFRYFGARDKSSDGDDVAGCRGMTFDHEQQVCVYRL